MTLLEEVKEKYKEGRNGDFRAFIEYYANLDRGEDPEMLEEIKNFFAENLSVSEMLLTITIVMERDKSGGE